MTFYTQSRIDQRGADVLSLWHQLRPAKRLYWATKRAVWLLNDRAAPTPMSTIRDGGESGSGGKDSAVAGVEGGAEEEMAAMRRTTWAK